MRIALVALLSLLVGSAQAQPLYGSGYPPPPPLAEPPPPSGIGATVVGAGALGIATLNLVTLPVCYADFYPDNGRDPCVISSLAIAGVGVAVGVPVLLLGIRRIKTYRAWKARNRAFAPLEMLSVSAANQGFSLQLRAPF